MNINLMPLWESSNKQKSLLLEVVLKKSFSTILVVKVDEPHSAQKNIMLVNSVKPMLPVERYIPHLPIVDIVKTVDFGPKTSGWWPKKL